MLKGKKIVLGVTGGIAVYKAVDLVSRLRKQGAEVRVVMSEAATKFVTPLTFQEISGNAVAVSMWNEQHEFHVEHIALAEWADLILVAPATANIMAKAANGIADNLLSTVLLAYPKTILFCPAMNTNMYLHPATQNNFAKIEEYGHVIMTAASGLLACGTTGIGRLPEPAEIVDFVKFYLAQQEGDLRGKRILVTAAGTREPIDPVRFVGNRSSGKMGYAVAQAASERGAIVTLVSGPSALCPPPNVEVINVETTIEMMDAVLTRFSDVDVVVKAAAVADYRCHEIAEQKIKKTGDDSLTLVLDKNPDILKKLGELKEKQILIGFAAETQNLLANAGEKIKKKNLNMIVANDVTLPGAGFNYDTNVVKLLFPDGTVKCYEQMTKLEVANTLLDEVKNLF